MTTQFGRQAQLLIGAGTSLIDLSQMEIEFQVQGFMLSTPKTATIRIYNLTPDTARRVTSEGAQVILSAGYAGNFNTIFNGQLIQARMGRENGTDTYLDITAATGDYVYNHGFLNLTISSGPDIIGRLGQIANAVGLKVGTIQAPQSGTALPRGQVFFGLARDHLHALCASIGADWCINDNGELDVIASGSYKPGDIPVINAASGLIGVPEQTEIGVMVRCLLNPNLQQNMLIQLDNAAIQQYSYSTNFFSQAGAAFVPSLSADGKYKVLVVNHVGQTRGNDWYTDLICYSNIVNEGQLQYLPKVF